LSSALDLALRSTHALRTELKRPIGRAFEAARAHSHLMRAPVGNGMVNLFKHEAKGRKILFFDRAVIVAVERFTEYGIHLALHGQQFFRRFRFAHLGNHGQDFAASEVSRREDMLIEQGLGTYPFISVLNASGPGGPQPTMVYKHEYIDLLLPADRFSKPNAEATLLSMLKLSDTRRSWVIARTS
jgi:hypothetical protein